MLGEKVGDFVGVRVGACVGLSCVIRHVCE